MGAAWTYFLDKGKHGLSEGRRLVVEIVGDEVSQVTELHVTDRLCSALVLAQQGKGVQTNLRCHSNQLSNRHGLQA